MHALYPELHQGLERKGEHDGCAVGIGGEESLPAPLLPLHLYYVQMFVVALRYEKGDILHHAI